jgi:hypothetical protein
MQSVVGVGRLPGVLQSQGNGQVFSLAMTILHLILERPLYQK